MFPDDRNREDQNDLKSAHYTFNEVTVVVEYTDDFYDFTIVN
jgi:hypothetical protein